MTRMSFHFVHSRAIQILLAFVLVGFPATGGADADDAAYPYHAPAAQSSGVAHEYAGRLEKQLGTLFPNSRIYLTPLNGRLIVKGQATNAEASARILQIVRSAVAREGLATANATVDPNGVIVNMLEVPSPDQVMLHLKIVEIKRAPFAAIETALEAMHDGKLLSSGGGPGVYRVLGNEAVNKLLNQVASKRMGRILAAPTLTVLNGHTASFLAGGEFPVPTIVGLSGVPGTADSFRQIGPSLMVRPEVIDSDWIKLNITPEFTELNGTPGIGSHRFMMVKVREGQSVVMTGLFSAPNAQAAKVPFLGELPVIGATIRQRRERKSDETPEVLVVVTPELVKPMDPDDVPPFPGFVTTSPNDKELYSFGRPWEIQPARPDERPPVAPLPQAHHLTDDVQYFPPGPMYPYQPGRPAAQPAPYPVPSPIKRVGYSERGNWVQRTASTPFPQSAPDGPQPYPASALRPDNSPHRSDWWQHDSSKERLGHLHRALAALQAAGLSQQVTAVQREITKEQLARKERQAEALQQQIQLLRRTLGVPSPIPESPLPTATP